MGAERLAQITQLQQRVEEQRVRDGLIAELRKEVDSLEGQLTRLQDEVCLFVCLFVQCHVCTCMCMCMCST